jgi:ferrous iron transport protein A
MISLYDMPVGKKGTITAIKGGYGLVHKLDMLGIHPGKEITKISNQLMKGPVIVRWGNTEIAIGYGMARRIMVEVK